MRLFFWYALHTFKNQLKKLFKTWVLIFFAVCLLLGMGIGALIAFIDGADGPGEPVEDAVGGPNDPAQELEDEPSYFERRGIEKKELVEFAAGALVLLLFTIYALNADKNGSKIFLPADVNLLFPSPMRPQSVLMFRLATQLGVGVLGSVYMLIQLPNLIYNLGLAPWAAVSLVAAWGLTVIFGALLQLALYTLSATYPAVKRNLRRGIYLALALVAASYVLYASRSGEGWLKAAVAFFNAPVTRFIPFWGWIKGLCGFALAGDVTGALLTLLALILGGAALVYCIWSIKADFYEDAMAKSEETAQLLAAAQSENATGVVVKRGKDRSDKLLRDGLNRGQGANVFFFKTMYNRRRFAHLGFLTKTMETYLLAALAVAAVCRFVSHTDGILPVALTLAALVFFRSLGNPLEQDTGRDLFALIPEPAWAKLFWSLMGGTVSCLLDVLPAVLAGALLAGANLPETLMWMPVIVSVDFYATTVGTFIALSAPVSAGKTLKQIVQVMFVYFGLLPDVVIVVPGIVGGHVNAAMLGAAAVNFGLGFLFLSLSPRFIERGGGRKSLDVSGIRFGGDIKMAKKQFSRLGLALFVFLISASVFQVIASVAAVLIWPEGTDRPGWVMWVFTFAPMYLLAAPLALLVMRGAPAAPREQRPMSVGRLLTAAAISVFLMYAGNIIGMILLALIEAASGSSAGNPLLNYAFDDSVVLRVLVMAVIAPLVEEFIFRKQLIDRMNAYGEGLAVFTSALLFGLFHGNLSQFFYAFALGLVFGYVYLKTGRLRYSVALHMFVNFLGSVLAPAVLDGVDLESLSAIDITDTAALMELGKSLLPLMAYGLAMAVLLIAGLVLFCMNVRKVRFDPAPLEIPKGQRFKTAYLNPGMILFILLCLISVAATFFV